ncbi:MAG: nucleotidyltransferase family protein [Candidatus Methylomirabilota bacterium]
MKPTALSSEALRTAGRNVVLLCEAQAIAAGLSERRVPGLFLKGIALIATGCAALEQRGMVDIDLLVHPRDLPEASAVLQAQGYAPRSNALLLHKRIGMVELDVDLHPGLWYFSREDPWLRSGSCRSGTRLCILCPEDALLHVILHSLLQDGALSGRALEDCRGILAAEGAGFRWELFSTIVAGEGWERPVGLFLTHLEATHPGTVPPAWRPRLPPPGEGPRRGPLSDWPYWRMISQQSRRGRKVGLLFGFFFPSPAFLRLRYSWMPRPLAVLLPLLRPLLLIGDLLGSRFGRTRP